MPVVIRPDTPKLYVGATEALKAYWGSTLVWEPAIPSAQFVWAGGNEDLSELATTCQTGDFIIVADSRNSTNAPSSLLDYTTQFNIQASAGGTNAIRVRLMTKFAAVDNEAVPAATGNRRSVAIYRNVDPTTPVHDVQSLISGTLSTDLSTPLVIPALTLAAPKLVVAGSRMRGDDTFITFSAPILQRDRQPLVTDSSWHAIGDSNTPLASFAGQNLAMIGAHPWVGWSLALNAAS